MLIQAINVGSDFPMDFILVSYMVYSQN